MFLQLVVMKRHSQNHQCRYKISENRDTFLKSYAVLDILLFKSIQPCVHVIQKILEIRERILFTFSQPSKVLVSQLKIHLKVYYWKNWQPRNVILYMLVKGYIYPTCNLTKKKSDRGRRISRPHGRPQYCPHLPHLLNFKNITLVTNPNPCSP